MAREETVKITGELCKSCGLCIINCPTGAISRSGEFNGKGYDMVRVDAGLCTACGICYQMCPDYVIEIS